MNAQKIALHKKAEYSKFLFSSVGDIYEEVITTKLLARMVQDSGQHTHFTPLESVKFQDGESLDEQENSYDFFFKLYRNKSIDTKCYKYNQGYSV